jgi:hypothetical protein
MHTRVPAVEPAADFYNTALTKQVGKSCYLPPFPPTQSIRDSTDDLYRTVVQGLDSSSSSSASVSSRGSSSSGIKNVVKKLAKRRSINVERDVQRFGGAEQRRSYFNSASRRELIQFGPEVCAVGHGIEYGCLNPMKHLGRNNNGFLLWIY